METALRVPATLAVGREPHRVALLGLAVAGAAATAAVAMLAHAGAESQPGLSAEMLLAHLEGRCAKYRWPRQFYFWDSLPKSGYGKVTKKDIRARLIERGDLEPVASS